MKKSLTATTLLAFGALALAATTSVSNVPTASGTPTIRLAATGSPASFTCRLPVSGPGEAGFLVFPARAQIQDSGVVARGAMTYLGARGWISATPRQLSPDGRSIAVADPRGRAIVITDGNGVRLKTFTGDVTDVIGWTAAGIVAWSPQLNQVWILNPSDGSHRAFPAGQLSFEAVSSAGIWSLSRGVWRMDAATGQLTRWYTFKADAAGRSGGSLLGFDSDGSPIVWDAPEGASGTWTVARIQGPNDSSVVATSAAGFVPEHALGDAHGVWLTSTAGNVWLASAAGLAEMGGENDYVLGGTCQ